VVRGLVNGHTHLELPRVATAAGLGLPTWIETFRAGEPPSLAVAQHNAAAVAATGTTAVVDISNLDVGLPAMAEAGLGGLALHEFFGIDRPTLGLGVPRATPHAPYSTHPDTIREIASRGARWAIHCDEDPAEREFLKEGTGLWREALLRWKRDLSWYHPSGLTPVRWLDSLGVLSPRALLVHCTLSGPEDLAVVAERGAAICVCPRSNLHITGRLPDVPAMFAAGVRVLIGTDSLSSTPDLDVRNELPLLRAAFPQVAESRWERCLTEDAWAWLDQPEAA